MSKVSTLEKQLLRTIEAADKSADRYAAKIKVLREQLKPNCSHSNTYPVQWIHDNGYGVQTAMPGLRCVICKQRNDWPGSKSWRDD